ncbi:MAG: DUF4388 domain-containing protein [Deltaproteobacteria bacterium]|nr:DUF4388 domain-containing protein [Deltaproteobacteria bacterium]
MMDKNRTLLALKRDEEIKDLTGYITGLGFDPSVVRDGARAIELAIQEVPSFVIADIDLPVIDAERVFHILRNNPHTSNIPFVFIADSVSDIKGFRTGIDVFLQRPINLDELSARVRQTLSARKSSGPGSRGIEGRLSHMSLADILQILHLNRKEGELRVTSGAKSGSVYIKDGEIYNSALEGTEKEKALFRLLSWDEGKFEFIPKQVTATKKIRSTTGNLLMEGMRQIDEFRKKKDQFPDKDKNLKSKVDSKTLPKGLQPVIYEVMQLVNSYPKVCDVVERSAYPDYEVYSTIVSMLARGILDYGSEEGAAAAVAPQFLTTDQAISIREKILSHYTDMNLNYGKIFLLSTSGPLASDFIKRCKVIPGFSMNTKSSFSQIAIENPLGEISAIKLYGGMDITLFSIPTVRNMGPLWRAFSENLIGVVMLWDEQGADELSELETAKKDILSKKRVPVLPVFYGQAAKGADEQYRKALGLKPDEPMFKMGPSDNNMVFEIFYSLFSSIIKDDYVR